MTSRGIALSLGAAVVLLSSVVRSDTGEKPTKEALVDRPLVAAPFEKGTPRGSGHVWRAFGAGVRFVLLAADGTPTTEEEAVAAGYLSSDAVEKDVVRRLEKRKRTLRTNPVIGDGRLRLVADDADAAQWIFISRAWSARTSHGHRKLWAALIAEDALAFTTDEAAVGRLALYAVTRRVHPLSPMLLEWNDAFQIWTADGTLSNHASKSRSDLEWIAGRPLPTGEALY